MKVTGGSLPRHTEKDVRPCWTSNFVDALCVIMGNFAPCSGAALMKIKQERFLPTKPVKSPFGIVGLRVNSLNLFGSPVGPGIIDP